MERAKWLFVTISAVLVLAACGQGEPDEDAVGGENNVGEEVTEETDEEGSKEENEESEESQEGDTSENEGTSEEESEESTEEDEAAMINEVTFYFSDDQLMEKFRVTSDQSVTSDEQGAKEALQEWAGGPNKEGLANLVPEGTTVQSVTFVDDVAHVSFSSEIAEANLGSSGELMLSEQLAMMMVQFGFDRTQLLIDEEVPSEFLGHLDVSEPFTAPDVSEYSEFE
ncbi:GerMN domain-containing protein [Alteribacter populi]|uniref:GerMN domain-containing protein n=1 Tax=Alteribacter populi TaxID=2011011 RepID=UPI000C2CA721|nr:GerMN domain-containing protein [Alteribacter populi]